MLSRLCTLVWSAKVRARALSDALAKTPRQGARARLTLATHTHTQTGAHARVPNQRMHSSNSHTGTSTAAPSDETRWNHESAHKQQLIGVRDSVRSCDARCARSSIGARACSTAANVACDLRQFVHLALDAHRRNHCDSHRTSTSTVLTAIAATKFDCILLLYSTTLTNTHKQETRSLKLREYSLNCQSSSQKLKVLDHCPNECICEPRCLRLSLIAKVIYDDGTANWDALTLHTLSVSPSLSTHNKLVTVLQSFVMRTRSLFDV